MTDPTDFSFDEIEARMMAAITEFLTKTTPTRSIDPSIECPNCENLRATDYVRREWVRAVERNAKDMDDKALFDTATDLLGLRAVDQSLRAEIKDYIFRLAYGAGPPPAKGEAYVDQPGRTNRYGQAPAKTFFVSPTVSGRMQATFPPLDWPERRRASMDDATEAVLAAKRRLLDNLSTSPSDQQEED